MEPGRVSWVQGYANDRISFVDPTTICFPIGNHIRFLNLETNTPQVFQNPHRGIGAFTASSRSGIFAFSDQKLPSSIFIYRYPNFSLVTEIKDSAELDYISLAFSNGGSHLASCTSHPDYIVAVWNWETTTKLCNIRNAGRNVIFLEFNPSNRFQFYALGKTFITVWNIENSGMYYILKPRIIDLPKPDGSICERQEPALFYFHHKVLNFEDEIAPLPFTTFTDDYQPTVEEALAIRTTLTPHTVCWTVTSELYVGCKEGFLLFVDPENLSVIVTFNPLVKDAIAQLKESNFQVLSIYENYLIVIGKGNVIHCLEIKGTQITITKSWKSEKQITNVTHYPDSETLLLSTDTGQLYKLNPGSTDEIETVLDIPTGNFLAAEFLPCDSNYCVSLKERELQLWTTTGCFLGSMCFEFELTSLACCSIAFYVAVGTVTGKVLFIDLNNEQPRLVHKVKLYHEAVEHVVSDESGSYIFTAGRNSHVYVLNGKPSMGFSVVGYLDISGHILSFSSQFIWDVENVKLLVHFTEKGSTEQESDKLMVVTLSVLKLSDPNCTDRHGRFSEGSVRQFICSTPEPITACLLRLDEIFTYCQEMKSYQLYHLPENEAVLNIHDEVPLIPTNEWDGHPLGPATLLLSPNYVWLASIGRDGLLLIRQTVAMEEYVEMQCHPCDVNGKRKLSFSPDGLSVLTTDPKDGSLVCTELRIQHYSSSKFSLPFTFFKEKHFSVENEALNNMPTTGVKSEPEELGTYEPRDSTSLDVTNEDEAYRKEQEAIRENLTWLEVRHNEIVRIDNEKYYEFKANLKEKMREIRKKIQEFLRDEEELLPEEQYNLNVEEQKRYDAMVEEEVAKARVAMQEEIEWRSYLSDVLKEECWDSVMVKGRAVKAFNSEILVENFTQMARTPEENELLRTVEDIRKFENAASSLSGKTKKVQEDDDDDDEEADGAPLAGSCSAELGYSNPYLYDQFNVNTTEQRINQIVLLQDVIYRVKSGFNTEFESLHKRKVRELKAINERNKLIKDMMLKLNITQELWEPELVHSEWPEGYLTVKDSEIKATRYFTPEEIEAEKRKLEEEALLLAARDDTRDRALEEMMEGQLEVKKVDILKVEIPPPEFVMAKPNIHWTDEEKKIYKDYEKKVKELEEEKDSYRQSLEIEIKKLHEITKDATEKFDEALNVLSEKKVSCTVAIYQEELKIAYLLEALQSEEEMKNEEIELKAKLENMLSYKAETTTEVKQCTKMYEQCREEYEKNEAEDKAFESDFKKDFADVPTSVVDVLQKLYKTRPRVQKARIISKSTLILHSVSAVDATNQTLKALEELDQPKNMPEGLSPALWEKFCQIRRTKVQSEVKVHLNALSLADMQEFLRKRMEEDSEAQQAIKKITKQIESLHQNRNINMINTMVQVGLKQGQVEVETTNLDGDTAETDFILYRKDVIDNLRGVIRNLAKDKVTTMEGRREVRKEIIQLDWEHRVLRKKIEDLHDKIKEIKVLRLTEEQQELSNRSAADQTNLMLKKVSDLEKTIAMMKEAHQKNIRHRKKKIEKIKRLEGVKAEKNATLEKQLPEMQVSVAELRNICAEAETGDDEEVRRKARHREVVERSRLEEIARKQSERLDVLWAEVERLTRKNFPSLDKLKFK